LRAWAWGAARGLDYLETDPAVNAKKVGIEGVSRFGKAALVTMAFEPRFAVALVGSSGEGGAKLHRRNFGEAVENLTGSGEYHWMAGNFLKYGAAEGSFGSKNAGDLPVDAHMLIALCAPRLAFISYGVPERGDANWLDQQGSYMATVAAGPVFRLLGARDIGEKEDYRTAKMPPVNTGLLDGDLAWRQHDGGHEDRSNMKCFIAWENGVHQTRPAGSSSDEVSGAAISGGAKASLLDIRHDLWLNYILNNQPLLMKRTHFTGFSAPHLAAIMMVASGALLLQMQTSAAAPSVVGWWRFNEGAGTTAADSSGLGNNGTLTGETARFRRGSRAKPVLAVPCGSRITAPTMFT